MQLGYILQLVTRRALMSTLSDIEMNDFFTKMSKAMTLCEEDEISNIDSKVSSIPGLSIDNITPSSNMQEFSETLDIEAIDTLHQTTLDSEAYNTLHQETLDSEEAFETGCEFCRYNNSFGFGFPKCNHYGLC